MKLLCVQMAALSVNTCETLIRAILEQLIEYYYGGERGTKRCMFAEILFFLLFHLMFFLLCFEFYAFEHTRLIMSLHPPLPTQMTFFV